MYQNPPSAHQRDFICPCGKSYLSMAALYTHVKTKHNGKAPGEIKRPAQYAARGRRRGRARSSLMSIGQENHFKVSPEDSWRKTERLETDEPEFARIRVPKDAQIVKPPTEQLVYQQLQNFRSPTRIFFQTSEGNYTCQDVASIFYKKFSPLGHSVSSGLAYFFNELKKAVQTRFGVNFWTEENPDEIIEVANLVIQMRDKQCLLERQQMVQLLMTFFEWMYEEKWTDHQLQRKMEYTSQICL